MALTVNIYFRERTSGCFIDHSRLKVTVHKSKTDIVNNYY